MSQNATGAMPQCPHELTWRESCSGAWCVHKPQLCSRCKIQEAALPCWGLACWSVLAPHCSIFYENSLLVACHLVRLELCKFMCSQCARLAPRLCTLNLHLEVLRCWYIQR